MSRWALILGAATAIASLASAVLLRTDYGRSDEALVWDEAALLGPAERRRIAEHHRRLRKSHDIDYRVLTHAGTGDLDRFSNVAFGERRVGATSRSGRGLLLVVDPAADEVRLEVAAALEGVYTDAFVAYLEHRQMVPFFASGRIADGILATSELIVARAARAAREEGFDAATDESFSLGGGARTSARIDEGGHRPAEGPDVAPGNTPRAAVAAYLEAMRTRNGRPDLALYTPQTRTLLEGWTQTPAQMDHVARAYARCPAPEVRRAGARAVVCYPPEARTCAPWFLRRDAGGWRLDLAAGQRTIRFNHDNLWRFALGPPDAYRFAFADWRFDRHGFPHAGL